MGKKTVWILLAVCLALILLGLVFVLAGLPEDTEEPTQTTRESLGTEYTTQPSSQATEQTYVTEPEPSTAPTVAPSRFTSDDFGYQNGYMACLTAPYWLGIDVSKHQGEIDWAKVAEAGVAFVMIRVGGRGYGQAGTLYADEMAQQNYAGAKAAGLKVGAYFFSQAVNVEEAIAEADYALAQVTQWQLDLPVVYDWEYVSETARTANTTAETVTACAAAFCDRIREVGKAAMIYVRPELEKLQLEKLTQYPQWVALYSDTMDYPNHFDMWQYTNTGKVPGIRGNVDINLYIPSE